MIDKHTKELEYLLNNFWCLKDQNPSLYWEIKNNLDYYKDFVQTKLGSVLIVNDRLIKLEKIPTIPKAYMGINAFGQPLEYVLLFLILLFLEDKPKSKQFILSNLIDFIDNTARGLELDHLPDWNIYQHRKCLVNVMHHLEDMGIIKVVDEIYNFSEDKQAEGLYESTGISNYYIRRFQNNILNYETIEDYLNDEYTKYTDKDIKRMKIYRNLLYSLVIYPEELTEFEWDYLRKFRGTISNELSKYTDGELEITKNMALLLFPMEGRQSYDFPNSKAICDIILLINNYLLELVDKGELQLNQQEIIVISEEYFKRIIKEVRNESGLYFSKYYKDLSFTSFYQDIVECMQEYDFLKINDLEVKIYPMVSKLIGYIPQDPLQQLDLFGGNYE